MMKDLFLTSGIVILLVMVFLYIFQRSLIYFPSSQTPTLKSYDASDMDVVVLKIDNRLQLRSWYKAAKPQYPTLLFLHGNAGHIGLRMPLVRQFLNAGFGVLLLEYRGYGGNKGSPTEQGLYADARAGMHFLLENIGLSGKNIVLFGESLGTGVATKIANEFPVCSVVLQSPFTSLRDIARYHYPWLMLPPWDKFDSLGRIDSINAPLLILHGTEDSVVPHRYGVRLFEKAVQPKKMLHFDKAEHNNISSAEGFVPAVIEFIETYC